MSTILAQIGAFLAERLTAIQEQFSSYTPLSSFNTLRNTVTSHTSSLSSLSSTKLTTAQLYAGTANLISKLGIVGAVTKSASDTKFCTPANTSQGAYSATWTITGPTTTYSTSSSATSETALIFYLPNTPPTDQPASEYVKVFPSSVTGGGNKLRYVWFSFYVTGWTSSTPPVNLITISDGALLWANYTKKNRNFVSYGYLQTSASTRRYFFQFSPPSSGVQLYFVTASCAGYYPDPHDQTVTLYRPMLSVGTALADWAPAPYDMIAL